MPEDQVEDKIRSLLKPMEEAPPNSAKQRALALIGTQSPQRFEERRRIRLLRRVTAVAAGFLLVLGVIGYSMDDASEASQPELFSSLPPVLTLEEDGFGALSPSSAIFQNLLMGDLSE